MTRLKEADGGVVQAVDPTRQIPWNEPRCKQLVQSYQRAVALLAEPDAEPLSRDDKQKLLRAFAAAAISAAGYNNHDPLFTEPDEHRVAIAAAATELLLEDAAAAGKWTLRTRKDSWIKKLKPLIEANDLDGLTRHLRKCIYW